MSILDSSPFFIRTNVAPSDRDPDDKMLPQLGVCPHYDLIEQLACFLGREFKFSCGIWTPRRLDDHHQDCERSCHTILCDLVKERDLVRAYLYEIPDGMTVENGRVKLDIPLDALGKVSGRIHNFSRGLEILTEWRIRASVFGVEPDISNKQLFRLVERKLIRLAKDAVGELELRQFVRQDLPEKERWELWQKRPGGCKIRPKNMHETPFHDRYQGMRL